MAYVATVSHSGLIVAYEMAELPRLCAATLLPLLVLGAQGALYFFGSQSKSNTTDPQHKVFLTMFGPFVFTIPILLRNFAAPTALTLVLLRWGLAFFAASAAWLLKLPECLFPPGTFDYLGNSHNVMHVMVFVVWRELHWGIRALIEDAAAADAARAAQASSWLTSWLGM